MTTEPKHPITPKDMKLTTGKFMTVKQTLAEHKCPECGGDMHYRWTTGTYKGLQKVAMIHAQCISNNDSDHGYGPKSRHTDQAYKLGTGVSNDEWPKEEVQPPKEENNDGMLEKLQKMNETPKMTKTKDTSNPFSAFESWLDDRVGERMDKVEAQVKELVAKGHLIKTLEIKSDTVEIKIEGLRHPVLDELCERYAMGERTFLLTGPAGTGKTTIARQFAKAIQAKRCTVIACSEDLRREAFVGFRTFNIKDGTAPYVASPIVEDLRVTDAATCTILEEIDASNPNALLTINALENGFLPTPECAEMPEHARPGNHVLIATANTWGTAGSTQYVGRNQLDAATLDRYRTLFVDYDADLEKALVGDQGVVDMVTEIRRKVNEAQIRKVVSTRLAKRIAFDRKLKGNAKKPIREVVRNVLVNSGWQAQELTRVGM